MNFPDPRGKWRKDHGCICEREGAQTTTRNGHRDWEGTSFTGPRSKGLTALHTTLTHLDQKRTYVRMLFVDYSSAFHTTVLSRFVSKLWNLDLSHCLCNWTKDFLSNCPQLDSVHTCTVYKAVCRILCSTPSTHLTASPHTPKHHNSVCRWHPTGGSDYKQRWDRDEVCKLTGDAQTTILHSTSKRQKK